MTADLFSFEFYAFGATAFVPVLLGLVIASVGVAFAVREGGSRLGLPFLTMALSAAVWLVADGAARAASVAELALWWHRLGHGALAIFPLSFLWFTHNVAGPVQHAAWQLRGTAVLGGALVSLALWSGSFIASVDAVGESYLPKFGWVGTVFSITYVATMLLAGSVYLRRLLQAGKNSSGHRRLQLLATSSLVGAFFGVALLPANGIPVFVEGHWVITCFFVLTAYVNGRYRVNDITPALIGAQIASTMVDALLVVDRDATLRQINPAAERLFGVATEQASGMPVRRLIGNDALRRQIGAMIDGRGAPNLELSLTDGDGGVRTMSVSASAVREYDEAARAFLFILRDISTRKKAEERIRELAYSDLLTGLPNRSGFNERLETLIVGGDASSLTLLFLDLDRFKRVNDTLGHAAGDRMLEVVARRLNHCLRRDSSQRDEADSIIARLGGDEFVICLSDVVETDVISRICERILTALSQPIDLDGQEVFSGASIGISRYPTDADTTEALLKTADLALYEAKDAGRNNFQFYDVALEAQNRERVMLEADIRVGLDKDQFTVHFQPLIDQRTRHTVGAEALLRWQHPTRGTVAPDQFVPVAEEAGLIPILGERVLQQACAAAAGWHALGLDHMTVAVNVSEHQFRRHNLVSVVMSCLDQFKLPPQALILELKESTIMNDVGQTMSTLDRLHALGVRICVDDFGTGYTSLNHLKRFPVDILKVDGTFTRGIATNANDAAITQTIISMARNLHLQVIAEGVETEAQAAFLRRAQCHFMQGYLFGAPVALDTFTEQLRDSRDDNAQPVPTLTLPALTSRAGS
ncbi:MAG: putative bifunctional diguanylate cyclase/phosphodiesterase [Gammaproteobacteria bacterium]